MPAYDDDDDECCWVICILRNFAAALAIGVMSMMGLTLWLIRTYHWRSLDLPDNNNFNDALSYSDASSTSTTGENVKGRYEKPYGKGRYLDINDSELTTSKLKFGRSFEDEDNENSNRTNFSKLKVEETIDDLSRDEIISQLGKTAGTNNESKTRRRNTKAIINDSNDNSHSDEGSISRTGKNARDQYENPHLKGTYSDSADDKTYETNGSEVTISKRKYRKSLEDGSNEYTNSKLSTRETIDDLNREKNYSSQLGKETAGIGNQSKAKLRDKNGVLTENNDKSQSNNDSILITEKNISGQLETPYFKGRYSDITDVTKYETISSEAANGKFGKSLEDDGNEYSKSKLSTRETIDELNRDENFSSKLGKEVSIDYNSKARWTDKNGILRDSNGNSLSLQDGIINCKPFCPKNCDISEISNGTKNRTSTQVNNVKRTSDVEKLGLGKTSLGYSDGIIRPQDLSKMEEEKERVRDGSKFNFEKSYSKVNSQANINDTQRGSRSMSYNNDDTLSHAFDDERQTSKSEYLFGRTETPNINEPCLPSCKASCSFSTKKSK